MCQYRVVLLVRSRFYLTLSGTLPAASAGAEYVMFCGPSDDVIKLSGEAVTVGEER